MHSTRRDTRVTTNERAQTLWLLRVAQRDFAAQGPRSSDASVTSSSLTGPTRSFSQRARTATTTKGHVYERTLEFSLGRYAEPVKCVLSIALDDAYASAVSGVMILEEV